MPLSAGDRFDQPTRISDVVKFEADSRYCREVQSVHIDAADTDDMVVGECLEWEIDAGTLDIDSWIKATAAADCDAILLEPLAADPDPAVEVYAERVVLVRGPAIVSLENLTYAAGFAAADVAASLAGEGILARTGPTYETLART